MYITNSIQHNIKYQQILNECYNTRTWVVIYVQGYLLNFLFCLNKQQTKTTISNKHLSFIENQQNNKLNIGKQKTIN